MQGRTRAMTEGALIAGIYLVLMLLSLYTPLGILTTLVLPVPFIVYATRHGGKRTLMVGAISFILSFVLGNIAGLMTTFFYFFLGMVMGVLYRLKKPAVFVVLGGMGVFIIQLLIALGVSIAIFDIDPFTELEMMMNSLLLDEQLFAQLGISSEQIETFMTLWLETVKQTLAALLILWAAVTAVINHGVARKLLKRLGMEASGFPPFREWKWPRSILYYYMAVLLLKLIPGLLKEGFLQTVVFNLHPILYVMLVIQGLSFIYWLAEQKKWNRTIPIVATVGLLFPPVTAAFNLLGILDLGFDFRKRQMRK